MLIYKVFIYLLNINTQWRTTATFNDTPIISYSDHRKTGLYQGSSERREGYQNFGIISLLQPAQVIHYCNQSVLAIVTNLKISVFSIMIFDLISRSALVRFILLCASSFYNSTGLRFYIFFRNQHRVFVIAIVTGEFTILILQKYVFKVCAISFGFWSYYLKVYIHLPCINTQLQTTAQFYLSLTLSRLSLLYWLLGVEMVDNKKTKWCLTRLYVVTVCDIGEEKQSANPK